MTNALSIVSTRVLSSPKVAQLEMKGWSFVQHDFISKVIQLPDTITPNTLKKNIVITSITGAKAFAQFLDQLDLEREDFKVFCISRGTKEYATALGLAIQGSAPNASGLADVILGHSEVKSVTHICSNLRRDELSEKLRSRSVEVHDIVVYQTVHTPVKLNAVYDAVLFFSPSAIDSFLSQNDLRQVPCFCIGATTAAHAKNKGYRTAIIAEAPSEDFLLEKVITYYTKDKAHA